MSDGTGNTQAFILAVIAFLGFFGYAIAVTVARVTPDPVTFPVIVSIVTGASAFFFSSHIANGAAGKALDAMVQTGKDRQAAISAATAATETEPKAPVPVTLSDTPIPVTVVDPTKTPPGPHP